MTFEQFTEQMARITDRFGHKNYPDDIVSKIYFEVKELAVEWFGALITRFLTTKRSAPLAIEFTHAAHSEKRRVSDFTRQMGNDGYESVFTEEERRNMLRFVKDVAAGKVPREKAMEFAKSVQKVIDIKSKLKCEHCENGIVFAWEHGSSGKTIFKCTCRLGQNRQEGWPVWSDHQRRQYVTDAERFRQELEPEGPEAS